MSFRLFGLTGGIASGKSTVAARFRELGLPVLDADQLSRQAVAPGTSGLSEIVKHFGEGVLREDGTLDRAKLGAIVFSDEEKRRTLNRILHPRIAARTMDAAQGLMERGETLGCYEASLIVENGLQDRFRPLVVVAASDEAQVARVMARDGLGEAEARARIAAQMPVSEKVKAADYVIHNDGSLEDLLRKADAVLEAIKKRVAAEG
jgi:dephospho-CoA kinase